MIVRLFAAAALASMISLPALAEPIPEAMLLRDFLQCSRAKPSDARHMSYCWCVSNELRDRMSFQAYLTESGEVTKRINAGVEPGRALSQSPNMLTIGSYCRRRS